MNNSQFTTHDSRCLLITGGAGFIGSNFIRYWLDQHPEDKVVNLDLLTYAGNPENLADIEQNPQYTFIRGDICDYPLVESIFRDYRIDTVVHFAAESHVDRSIDGPDIFIYTNVTGTHTLLKAAKASWLDSVSSSLSSYDSQFTIHNSHSSSNSSQFTIHNSRFTFLHVSTDEVYGSLGPNDPAFTEQTPLAPNSPYSASKASSDLLVRSYWKTFGLPAITSRCSNNYGPYQFPEKLIPFMFCRAMAGETLPVYGDGKNVRDWIYVLDHCRGLELALEKRQPGRVYNFGGNAEMANIDLVRTLLAELGKSDELIEFVTDRPGHDRRYAMDNTLAQQELGFRPEYSFEAGLANTLRWYKANPEWLDRVRSGEYKKFIEKWYSHR